MIHSGHLCQLTHEMGEGVMLTETGQLLGGLRREGIDAACLSADEQRILYAYAWLALAHLRDTITVTEYYLRFRRPSPIELGARAHPIAHLLRQELAESINAHAPIDDLNFVTVSARPRMDFNSPNWVDRTAAGLTAWNPQSRQILRSPLRSRHTLVLSDAELDRQFTLLHSALDALSSTWSDITRIERLDSDQLWRATLAISHCDPSWFTTDITVPDRSLALKGLLGELSVVQQGSYDAMFLATARPKYIRIASAVAIDDARPSAWAAIRDGLCTVAGNFCAVTRAELLNLREQAEMVRHLAIQVERASMPWKDILTGQASLLERDKSRLKPHIRAMVERMEEIEAVDDQWVRSSNHLIVWDADVARLYDVCDQLEKVAKRAGIDMAWERMSSLTVYRGAQVGARSAQHVAKPATLSYAARLTLPYGAARGHIDLQPGDDPEPQMIFRCTDGSIYPVSPDSETVAMTIIFGSMGSGKSVIMNTFGAGLLADPAAQYVGLAIDDATQSLVDVFGGHTFCIDADAGARDGFNVFAAMESPDDEKFAQHLNGLLVASLELHPSEELRHLSAEEEEQIYSAVCEAMHRDRPTLALTVSYMPPTLRRKFAHLIRSLEGRAPGQYAVYFDCDVDQTGGVNTRVQEYNLKGVAENEPLIRLLSQHVFFRTVRAFEHPDRRTLRKHCAIHEARYFVHIPEARELLEEKMFTWRKNRGGITLGFQHPGQMPESFDSVLSQCTTKIFCHDKEFKPDAYRERCALSDSEIDTIAMLPEHGRFLLKQSKGRDSVSKVVAYALPPHHAVICTSSGGEVAARRAVYQTTYDRDGPVAAVKAAAAAIERYHAERRHIQEQPLWSAA